MHPSFTFAFMNNETIEVSPVDCPKNYIYILHLEHNTCHAYYSSVCFCVRHIVHCKPKKLSVLVKKYY